jgi:hypothetical protein
MLVVCQLVSSFILALGRCGWWTGAGPARCPEDQRVEHGTFSLYAALDIGTGCDEGRTARRHTSHEFLALLERRLATQPSGREIHLTADSNLSAHKPGRPGLARGASTVHAAMHSDPLREAQSGRAVVCQDRARLHRAPTSHTALGGSNWASVVSC